MLLMIAPPAPLPDPQPLLDAGDWIAIGVGGLAALIAAVGVWYARQSVLTARKSEGHADRSADAAEKSAEHAAGSATEARTANELTREQIAAQQRRDAEVRAEAIERAADQARQVRIEPHDLGGLQVRVCNDSEATICRVRLLEVVGDPESWKWHLHRRVMGGQRELVPSIAPGEHAKFFVNFTDDNGEVRSSAGQVYMVTYRFTDSRGVRWQKVGSSGRPEQVPTDDSDLDEPAATGPGE